MTHAEAAARPAGGGRIRGTVAVLRQRLPFTSSVTLAMLVLAVVTGALWNAAEDRAAYPFVAYGLPSL